MNLEDEMRETILKIGDELRKGNQSLLDETLKSLEVDPEGFMVFVNLILDNSGNLMYKFYKSLLPHLNTFEHPQEILKLYIKIVSALMEEDNDNYTLEFVKLLHYQPSAHLKNIFFSPSSSCLTTSLIMFGEFLFLKKWYLESYKVLYVASQSITVGGLTPTKEIMIRYLVIISTFFLRSGNFYSFFNALYMLVKLDKHQIEQFGDTEQFKSLFRVCKVKNEGAEYSQLLCKMPLLSDSELDEFVNGIEASNSEGLISQYVDLTKYNLFLKTVGHEIDLHDYSFVSFLKKNNFIYKITDKKVEVGEYKFKSISDDIFDIIELYKPKIEASVDVKKRISTPKQTIVIEKSVNKKKTRKFKDHFSLKKAKYVVYCEILSKNYEEIDLKYEVRTINRTQRLEKQQRYEEERRCRLKGYYDTIMELKYEIQSRFKVHEKVREYPSATPQTTSKKSWRDIEEEEAT